MSALYFTLSWAVLLVAGLVGAFARALTSNTTVTWSRQTYADTIVGGVLSAVIYVILTALPIIGPALAKLDTIAESAMAVGGLGYISGHLWVNRGADWLAAIGDRWFRGPAA